MAFLLWPLARFISGQLGGLAPHVADGLIMLAAAFWLQKRRSVVPAVILLAYSATISYFRYLANGSMFTLVLGLILVFVFLGGVLAALRLRAHGSRVSGAGP